MAATTQNKRKGADWYNDSRGTVEGTELAPLGYWDEIRLDPKTVLVNSDSMAVNHFARNASTVYERIGDNAIEAEQSNILLARHIRLQQLLTAYESSNAIDFYLFKWPLWILNEWVQRRAESKQFKNERRNDHV